MSGFYCQHLEVGKKYGRLTALRYVGKKGDYLAPNGKCYGKTSYEFQCECGNVSEHIATQVHNGRTKSCGNCRTFTLEKLGLPVEHYQWWLCKRQDMCHGWAEYYPRFANDTYKYPYENMTLRKIRSGDVWSKDNLVFTPPYEQIAEWCNIPIGTVRSRVNRLGFFNLLDWERDGMLLKFPEKEAA